MERLSQLPPAATTTGRGPLRTVLYVDDEPDIRQIVAMALKLAKLTVRIAESGQDALTAARGSRPDLILLDVMMPGLDGPGTLRLLQADPLLADIPVVFVTAKAMPQEVARFRELGAIGVIAKPFDPMGLAQQVMLLWDQLPPARTTASSEARPHTAEPSSMELDPLRLKFLERTLGQRTALQELAVRTGRGDPEASRELAALAHQIRGTGGTLGFEALCASARQIEELCRELSIKTRCEAGDAVRLETLVEELVRQTAAAAVR